VAMLLVVKSIQNVELVVASKLHYSIPKKRDLDLVRFLCQALSLLLAISQTPPPCHYTLLSINLSHDIGTQSVNSIHLRVMLHKMVLVKTALQEFRYVRSPST